MLRDIRWSAVGHVFTTAASLVTVPLLTRALVPTQYGLYKSVFVVTALALFFGNFNVTALLRKSIPQADKNREELLAAGLLAVQLPIALGAVALWFAAALGGLRWIAPTFQIFAEEHLVALTLLLWAILMYNTLNATLSGFQQFRNRAIVQVLVEGVFLVITIILFFIQAVTLSRIVWSYLAARLFGILLAGGMISPLLARPDFSRFRDEFRSVSLPLLPRTVFKNFGGTIPNAVIVGTFGPAVFAAWSVAFAFNKVFLMIGKPVSDVLLPELSNRVKEEETLEWLFIKYYRLITLANAPLVVGGWLVGDDIVRNVFGAGYEPAGFVIPLLLTSFGLQTVNTMAAQYFIATDNSGYETISRFIEHGLRIVIVLFGAFIIESLVVVAAAYLISKGARFVFALWYQWDDGVLTSPNSRTAGALCTSLVAMVGFVQLTDQFAESILGILIVVSGGGLVYFLSLYFTGLISEIERRLVREVIGIE